MRQRPFPRLIIGLLLIVVALLAGCDQTTPTPGPPTAEQPTVEVPTAEPSPPPTPAAEGVCTVVAERGEELTPTSSFYAANQVILSGPAEAVDRLAAEFGLAPLVACDLGYLAGGELIEPPSIDGELAKRPFSAAAYDFLAASEPFMGLYRIGGGTAIEQLVSQINDAGAADGVRADPNYLTGFLAQSPCADPFGAEGSPFGAEGSPFGAEGSLYGGMGLDAPEASFAGQWAYEQIGAAALRTEGVETAGEGVIVGVFDTSPYPPGSHPAPAATVSLLLQVTEPAAFAQLNYATTITLANTVKDHGLFVAGLVHGIAGESAIHLIRVLDDNGCGDLFVLSQAMHDFLAGPARAYDRVVLNLSLGVLQPRDPSVLEERGFPEEIVALETAVLAALGRGAVVVAAAGNDSTPISRLPAQLPAAYDGVIGVAASNLASDQSCYANMGDVLAPGGEGLFDQREDPPLCRAQAYLCPDGAPPEQCPWGVISLSTLSKSGFAYWVGSSFATPLVSGQAALLLQAGTPATLVPATVISTISPAGVIDVPSSLP